MIAQSHKTAIRVFFNVHQNRSLALKIIQELKVHLHRWFTDSFLISSSSSCRAACTDIPGPLSPLLPIVHRLSIAVHVFVSRVSISFSVDETLLPSVTWYPTETIEIRLILSSRLNEQWQPVKKVTVKKECRSQRGYQQMLVLSNLRSPDTGRENERESKWLAGTLKQKWHLLPVGEKKNEKKNQLLEGAHGRQTHSHYSGWRRQKHILDTRDPSSSSQC